MSGQASGTLGARKRAAPRDDLQWNVRQIMLKDGELRELKRGHLFSVDVGTSERGHVCS